MYKIRSAAPKNYKKYFLLDDHFGEVRKNFNFQRDFCIDGFFFKGENTNFVTPPLQSQKQIQGGGVVIRSDTKPPGDLITTHFRGNLKIVGPYSHTFPAPKKLVRPYKDPLSRPKKKSETL